MPEQDRRVDAYIARSADFARPILKHLRQLVQGGCLMDMTKEMTKEQTDDWTAKYRAGPAGLLLYHPGGREPMDPKQLVIEFLATALCGLIAAFILVATVGSLICRASLVAMMGLFTWLAVSVSQWNWYGYPFSFIALDAIDQVIGWLLAGLLMAKMIKPANQPPAPSIR